MRDAVGLRVARRAKFVDVEVVRNTGLLLQCRVGTRVVGVPITRLLSGTNVMHAGDRGVLVLSRELALNVGLVSSDGD